MKKRKLSALLLGAALVCSICATGCGNHKASSQSVLESTDGTERQESSFGNRTNLRQTLWIRKRFHRKTLRERM